MVSDFGAGPRLSGPFFNIWENFGKSQGSRQKTRLCAGVRGVYNRVFQRLCGIVQPMNTPPDIDRPLERREVLKIELQTLRQEHRDLDDAIAALHADRLADALALRRLKKKKLDLKDRIRRIEDELTPDIIA